MARLWQHQATCAAAGGNGDAFGYGGIARAVKALVDDRIAPSLIGKDASAIGQLSYFLQQGNHLLGRYGITMFAISGIIYYNTISEDKTEKILGIPNQWFWAIGYSAFCVFVE